MLYYISLIFSKTLSKLNYLFKISRRQPFHNLMALSLYLYLHKTHDNLSCPMRFRIFKKTNAVIKKKWCLHKAICFLSLLLLVRNNNCQLLFLFGNVFVIILIFQILVHWNVLNIALCNYSVLVH